MLLKKYWKWNTAPFSVNVRVIERESLIRLSQEDARNVLSLLDHPPKPNKRLKDAVKLSKERCACKIEVLAKSMTMPATTCTKRRFSWSHYRSSSWML